PDARLQEAARHLTQWDHRFELDSVGATLFDVFFSHWTKAVVRERLDGEVASLLAGGAAGLAARLLVEDWCGWFTRSTREAAIQATMQSALTALTERLGPDMNRWTWDRVHVLPLRHALSGR